MKIVFKILLFLIMLIIHQRLLGLIFQINNVNQATFISFFVILINLVITSSIITFMEKDNINRNASICFSIAGIIWFSSFITGFFIKNHTIEYVTFMILIIFPEILINLPLMNNLKSYFQEIRLKWFLPIIVMMERLVCNAVYISVIIILVLMELKLIIIPIFLLIVISIEIYFLVKLYHKWSKLS